MRVLFPNDVKSFIFSFYCDIFSSIFSLADNSFFIPPPHTKVFELILTFNLKKYPYPQPTNNGQPFAIMGITNYLRFFSITFFRIYFWIAYYQTYKCDFNKIITCTFILIHHQIFSYNANIKFVI